jgi:hypothetical protein
MVSAAAALGPMAPVVGYARGGAIEEPGQAFLLPDFQACARPPVTIESAIDERLGFGTVSPRTQVIAVDGGGAGARPARQTVIEGQ